MEPSPPTDVSGTATRVPADVVITAIRQLQDIDKKNIKTYGFFAAALVIAGIAVLTAAYFGAFRMQPELVKGIVSLGGVFVGSLSSLPLKEIMTRRDRIRLFEYTAQMVRTNPDRIEEYRATIERLMWKRLEA
jgi:hypothetical protein